MPSRLDALRDNVSFSWGLFYLHSNRGREAIRRLAQLPGIQRLTDVGIGVFVLMMITSVALLADVAVRVFRVRPEPTAAQDPVNLLAIPGVNDFLPLSAAGYIIIALFIAAGLHELAHAVALKREDVPVEEFGIVLFTVFPIAAYVMPDEDRFEESSPRSKARVYTAGVFMNLLVFLAATGVFLLPVTQNPIAVFVTYFGSIMQAPVPGDMVLQTITPLSNLLFWIWFFNINLAFVNALPIVFVDGGQFTRLAAYYIDVSIDRSAVSLSIVMTTTLGTAVLFVVAVFGPLLLS